MTYLSLFAQRDDCFDGTIKFMSIELEISSRVVVDVGIGLELAGQIRW